MLKALCALCLLWVLYEWAKAMTAAIQPGLNGVEKRTTVVVHMLRASLVSAVMCAATWLATLTGHVTHSSAVAGSLFCATAVTLMLIYLAAVYGWAAYTHRRGIDTL
ncbi:hypothetical protein [Burkholderia cenocepacia]|uniref:hypothetical protein n=1 Tax=Burkholderia cenocepacia TaxID=95486 RepID=UPI0038460700